MDFGDFQQQFDQIRSRKIFQLSRPDPQGSEEEIREAESKVGCKFGTKYRSFLEAYGGGKLGPLVLFSVHPGSRWNIVNQEVVSDLLVHGFLPFSPNFSGDYYGFPVEDGIVGDQVLFCDHETDSIQPSRYADIFEYIVEQCNY
jgi:hypothetical protein